MDIAKNQVNEFKELSQRTEQRERKRKNRGEEAWRRQPGYFFIYIMATLKRRKQRKWENKENYF